MSSNTVSLRKNIINHCQAYTRLPGAFSEKLSILLLKQLFKFNVNSAVVKNTFEDDGNIKTGTNKF